MANQVIFFPIEVKQGEGNRLVIRWQDQHESQYESHYLRMLCRCAGCVDEWSGQRKNEGDIPDNIHPIHVQGVGRYGIKIDWSDGHNTGIYTFKYLKEICPCSACGTNVRRGDS